MNLEPVPDQNEIKESSISLPFPTAGWGRLLIGLFIVAITVFSFWATNELFKPEWQSKESSAYIALLLSPEASLLLFPLLAYSIISYILLLATPIRAEASLFVRMGIYTGVLLAMQYSLLTALFLFADNSSANSYVFLWVWILPLIFAKLYPWAVGIWGARKTLMAVLLVFVTAVVLIAISSSILMSSYLVLMQLAIVSPFLFFLIFLRTSIWLVKYHETRFWFSHGMGITLWLAVYIAALRFDILKMYELYAALPPQPPPDCYIATAAARGHPQFVRSWTTQYTNGKSMQVNKQLQVLKYAELVLLAIHPRMHKRLRKVYDTLGKPLANRIQNPFTADIAYLALKPSEWLAKLILKILIPNIDLITKEIYTRQ